MPTIDDVFDQVVASRAELGVVDGVVDGISGVADGISTVTTGISGVAGGISDFLGIGGGGPGDLLGAVRDAVKGLFLDGGFLEQLLEEIAGLLGELANALTSAFGNAVAVEGIQEALWDTIEGIVDKLLEIFTRLIDQLGAMPMAISAGPLDALKDVRELGEFLNQCGHFDVVLHRLSAVEASLTSLFELVTGNTGVGSILFGQVFGTLNGALRAAIDTTQSLETVLFNAIKDIIFPRDLLLQVLRNLSAGNMWAWGTLPTGILTGQLNAWLNDPANYETLGSPATPEDEKRYRDTQREFRVRMVAAADSYLRRELGESPSPLSLADQRVSPEAIADVVIIFIENMIGFSLEPECYPRIDAEWDGVEDIGFKFAATLAKQIRVMVRSTIGLLLRGFWEFSVQSYALVELVAALIGAIVSAFIEGVVRNIAFSFQIVSRYQGSPVGGSTIALQWFSLETVEDTGADNDRLEYVALFRLPCDGMITIPARIQGLVKDIGAYIDATYRRIKVENNFVLDQTTDRITITRAELMGTSLKVWATTSATFEQPQPVLRAYVCCEIMPMRPGARPGDPYTIDVDVTRVPRCLDVFVLSNRGGVARRPLAVL